MIRQIRITTAWVGLLSALLLCTGCSAEEPAVSEQENTAMTTSFSTGATETTPSTGLTSVPTETETSSTTAATTRITEATSHTTVSNTTVTRQPTTTAPTSVATTAPSPPASLEERARELLASLTVEEKVGQLFLARCPASGGAETVRRYQPGGYVLFARDFQKETPASVRSTIQRYQAAAKIPLLISVDEEGGNVNRVSRYPAFRPTPFASPQGVYATGGWEGVVNDTYEKADLLLSLGINVNLAPVCDVPYAATDYIYPRSFSTDAVAVSRYVGTVVRAMKEKQLGSVLKHFPGYGNNVDTHTGVAVDNRPLSSFLNRDFLPFQAGIEAGAGAILVSHNIMAEVEKDIPSSLSPAVHRVLRDQLGFTGVIVTDDLSMGAVKAYAPNQSVGVAAVLAGNDLLCCTDYETEIPAVLAAVRDGTISVSRLDESVLRILRWKLSLQIIPQ